MLNEAGQDELVIAIQTENEPQKPDLDLIRRDFANFDSVRFLVLEEFPHAELRVNREASPGRIAQACLPET